MSELALGQRVKFTRHLHRRARTEDGARRTVKRWEPEGYPGQPEPEWREGVVVGRRTLSNGHVTWGGWEDPGEYQGVHYFRAYLIAYDLTRKPVLVLPEHMKGIDQ